MQEIWSITIDDYINIIDMAKANGKKPGDSMEEELRTYMNIKNQKPVGRTELNKEEFIAECISKNQNVADFKIDNNGTCEMKIFKKKDEI